MSSAAYPPRPPPGFVRFLFEVTDSYQTQIVFWLYSEPDIIINNPPPSSHSDSLYIKLYTEDVTRSFYFSQEDGEAMYKDNSFSDPARRRREQYVNVEYKSNNNYGGDDAINLNQFLEDPRMPPEALASFAPKLWSFAREVQPVTVGESIVRPFDMGVKFIKLEYYDRDDNQVERTAWESLATAGPPKDDFSVDSFDKVRFNEGSGDMVDQCCICFEEFKVGMDVTCLPCLHIYHGDCVVQWLNKTPTCPLYRFPLTESGEIIQ